MLRYHPILGRVWTRGATRRDALGTSVQPPLYPTTTTPAHPEPYPQKRQADRSLPPTTRISLRTTHAMVRHQCPLAQFPRAVFSGCVSFSLSVLVRTPSLQCTTSSALQKCSPQQWWPGRTFPRAAPDMYLLSTSYALAPPGRRRAGLMAPEERKSRWSLGGQDYEVLESRGWHGKRGRKSLLPLLMLPPPDAHGSAVPWREKAAAATAPADAREGQKHECQPKGGRGRRWFLSGP